MMLVLLWCMVAVMKTWAYNEELWPIVFCRPPVCGMGLIHVKTTLEDASAAAPRTWLEFPGMLYNYTAIRVQL